jgi:hypothetical protein
LLVIVEGVPGRVRQLGVEIIQLVLLLNEKALLLWKMMPRGGTGRRVIFGVIQGVVLVHRTGAACTAFQGRITVVCKTQGVITHRLRGGNPNLIKEG